MFRAISITIKWATSLAIIASIVWQVTDRVAHNVFRPGEYFAYFTIQSSMLAAVTLAAAGWFTFKRQEETKALAISRLSVGCFMAVTGIVYNALLRGLPAAAADANYEWPVVPNEILHVWAPILIAVDLVVFAPALHLKFKEGLWVWAFPFAWLGFSVVRGLATDWWPYWFINPNDDGGVTGMLTYVFGIMMFLWMLALSFQALMRVNKRLSASRIGS